MSSRTIELQRDVARRQREQGDSFRLARQGEGTLVVQIMASPGAGKTTLLEETARRLAPQEKMAVLVGDLATERDAERLNRVTTAVQLTTGGACHLEMSLVENGYARLTGNPVDYLFVEDVGNLVCPASHDVGHHLRVTLLSVTEGDDKAAKYPKAFRTSQALVISKIDLLPHVKFSIDAALDDARRVQPALDTLCVSACSGQGMNDWLAYLRGKRTSLLHERSRTGESL